MASWNQPPLPDPDEEQDLEHGLEHGLGEPEDSEGRPLNDDLDSEGVEGVPGPVPEVPEDWEDEENEQLSPQPDDPDGVNRDMASVALDRGLFAGRAHPALSSQQSATGKLEAGSWKREAGPVDWRSMTDAEIMLRVREGDDVGFNFLIEKYRKPIINFMYRMVHNQAVAEELAQEVFLRVYRSRQTYRAEAKFTTWLYRIATNLGVNHARDTKHERAAQTIYLDQPDPETGTTPDVADMHPGAEEEMVKDERMRAIRKHVMALPERQRTAVLMHKYQGLDYKEIGAVLRLSESATKSLLFRAYQTLRERLKEFVDQV